jgi:hypothetical protein
MSKADLQTVGVLFGLLMVFVGIAMMIGNSSGSWTLEVAAQRSIGILVGGFTSILGAIITLASLGVLDDAASALSDLWNGLVDALGR